MKSKIKKLARVTGISGTTVVALVLVGSLVVQAIAPLLIAGGAVALGGFLVGGYVEATSPDPGLNNDATELEIYQSALDLQAGEDSYLTVRENYNGDTKQVALGKVQFEICKSINKGDPESVAVSNATAAVNEYYSVQQYNNYQQWNAQIERINSTAHTELAADGSSDLFRTIGDPYNATDSEIEQYGSNWGPNTEIVYVDRTLPNGTTTERANALDGLMSDGQDIGQVRYVTNPDWTVAQNHGIVVKDPQTGSYTTVTDLQRYQDVVDATFTKATEVQNGIPQYAADIYSAVNSGTIDPTTHECVDPTVIAGQTPDDGSTALTFAAYAATAGGYTTSSQANVNVIDHTTGQTYDVIYFTNAQPSTTYDFDGDGNADELGWLTATYDASKATYNAADYAEPINVIIVNEDGTTKLATLDGEFTINSATSYVDGTQVDALAVNEYSQKTFDASRYIDENQAAQDAQNEYSDSDSNGAGGAPVECSTSFGGFCLDGVVTIATWVIAGIAGLVVLRALGIVGNLTD